MRSNGATRPVFVRAVQIALHVAMIATMSAAATGRDLVTVDSNRITPNPLLTIDKNRTTVVERIVVTWGDELAASDAGLTRDQLQILLSGLRSDHLLAASLAGSLEGLRNAIATAITSTADVKSNLIHTKALGDATQDLVYVPLAPCRIVDTVAVGGVIPALGRRNFIGTTATNFSAQGGNTSTCGIAQNAAAVQTIATVVGPTAQGFLIIYPYNAPQPSALTLVYPANSIATTAVTISLTKGQAFEFTAFLEKAANLQVDVVGYFHAPPSGYVTAVTASAPLASSGGIAPNISLTGGNTGQTLMGTAGAPTWTGSPTFGGNIAVVGTTLLGGNVGLGTNTPQARFHVLSVSDPVPPRVESWGNGGFAAGWDFYWNGTGKGYVGAPDPGAAFGPGELILFGGPATKTSLWAGQTRAVTIAAANRPGNVGIGTLPDSNARLIVDSGANDVGIYSTGSNGNGVVGVSTSSAGVYGFSNNAAGVRGISGSNSGVYGETSVSSLTAAGVYGKGAVSGAIGVAGEASIANAVGVYGRSASASGFGVYASSPSGRALYAEGNATQDFAYNGIVKAIVEGSVACCVNGFGYHVLLRCYNGAINSSSGNCGFTFTSPLPGVARIDFGYPITGRFFSVSAKYETTGNSTNNSGANYRLFNANTMEVFTFASGNSADTQARQFTLVMY